MDFDLLGAKTLEEIAQEQDAERRKREAEKLAHNALNEYAVHETRPWTPEERKKIVDILVAVIIGGLSIYTADKDAKKKALLEMIIRVIQAAMGKK